MTPLSFDGPTAFEERAMRLGVGFPFRARVLEHVVDMVNDSHVTIAELGAVIGWNPILSRTIAMKANSAFGLPGKVRDVNLALALLGSNMLRETLKHAVASGATRHIVYSFQYCEELWNHSLTCALIARSVAAHTGAADPEHAFVAGLVHDVGFLFLGEDLPSPDTDRFIRWQATSDNGKTEQSPPVAFHEEAGSWMVGRWHNVPREVIEAVRCHHDPSLAHTASGLTAVIHVADSIAHHFYGSPVKSVSVPGLDSGALALLGLPPASPDVSPREQARVLLERVMDGAPALELKVKVIKESVIDGFEQLPEQERFLLALHYYEGISFRAIAGVLGVREQDILDMHVHALGVLRAAFLEAGEAA